jgi:hypothetical protein
MAVDKDNYRDIAKLRSAYHSSSYDYNLTAQLVTDGIITDKMPGTINLSTSQGTVSKTEREWLFDFNSVTTISFEGIDVWLQLDLEQGENIPEITRISLNG